MDQSSEIITRRDFIRTAAEASFAVAVGLPLYSQQDSNSDIRTSVVLVRHPEAVDSRGKISAPVVEQMLDDAICALADNKDTLKAWKHFIGTRDVVGVKSNVWGPLPTPKELERVVVRRLLAVGVAKKNVSVDDRGVLRNRVFRKSTALINMRPLRTHHWSGVGGCIKNYIMFDRKPSKYHPDSCASLGALWQLPAVKNKTRLNILVMLTPLFHGIGPHHWNRKYTWPYRGVVVGIDPVAVDTVGLRILEAYRLKYFSKIKPLWPPAKHIALADSQYHVGISDLQSIRIIKRGWKEEILIDAL